MNFLKKWFDKWFLTSPASEYGAEYDAATTTERAALKAHNKKMFMEARCRRRDILVGKGIMPWF